MDETLRPMTKAQAKKAVWLAMPLRVGGSYRVICRMPDECIMGGMLDGTSVERDCRTGHKIVAAIRNMLTTNAVMRVAAKQPRGQ